MLVVKTYVDHQKIDQSTTSVISTGSKKRGRPPGSRTAPEKRVKNLKSKYSEVTIGKCFNKTIHDTDVKNKEEA